MSPYLLYNGCGSSHTSLDAENYSSIEDISDPQEQWIHYGEMPQVQLDSLLYWIPQWLLSFSIVDVRVADIRKLDFLSNRQHMVTANYNTVLYSYLWGPLDINP